MLTNDRALNKLIKKGKKKKKRKLNKRDGKNWSERKLKKEEENARKDEIKQKKQAEKLLKSKTRKQQSDVGYPVGESDAKPEPRGYNYYAMKFPIMSVCLALTYATAAGVSRRHKVDTLETDAFRLREPRE